MVRLDDAYRAQWLKWASSFGPTSPLLSRVNVSGDVGHVYVRLYASEYSVLIYSVS